MAKVDGAIKSGRCDRALADLAQYDQSPTAGCDLRERHQLHPVARGQDRDVAGAALSAVAGGDDQPPTANPVLITATTIATMVTT